MHILYKITFLPHINTKFPKYYVGSKYNYKGNYFGSVSSRQIFEFTDGLSLKEWWKLQLQNRQNFLFEILHSFEDISPDDLVLKEKSLHLELNVMSDEYFNQSVATSGFCSKKKSDETKKRMSEKTKQFWDSEEGKAKKSRLIERNKTSHAETLRQRWQNPSDAMKNRVNHGRKKGSKDISPRKKKIVKKIKYKDIIFNSAKEAAEYVGIDPVNIRRRCRINYMNEWSYYEDSDSR